MLYLYAERTSATLLSLLDKLHAVRLRRFDGLSFWERTRRVALKADAAIVCWDGVLPGIDGVRVLNSQDSALTPKRKAAIWQENGISCLNYYNLTYDPANDRYISAGYWPRLLRGGDLLQPDIWAGPNAAQPDYYVYRYSFAREYRVHSFGGRSIKAGECMIRDGFQLAPSTNAWKPNSGLAHPWVRTFEGGWNASSKGFVSSPTLRGLAHRAVKTLGLTFGLVSVGQVTDGNLVVIDVKPVPEVTGEMQTTYVRSIMQWYEEGK